jgi:hypothetical protein
MQYDILATKMIKRDLKCLMWTITISPIDHHRALLNLRQGPFFVLAMQG